MKRIFLLLIIVLLSGCTTNQLHFAPYTLDAELTKIRNAKIDVDVIETSGGESCTSCSESSKIVWHAANNKRSLYEGFSNIPVENWSEFTKSSLGATSTSSAKARIEIKRIFLKTWQNPQYYACQTEILVYLNKQIYHGKSIVKIQDSGQELPRANLAKLNPETLKAIELSIKSAYLNAMIGDHAK